MTEIWCPVPHIPLLEASSLGRVRSKPYWIEMPNGGFVQRQLLATKGHITKSKSGNYLRYQINFRRKSYVVSRIVCLTFNGPAPFESAEAMHDDENSLNNAATNLQWGSRKENSNAPKYLDFCRREGYKHLTGGAA